MAKVCIKCGNILEDSFKFCGVCGTPYVEPQLAPDINQGEPSDDRKTERVTPDKIIEFNPAPSYTPENKKEKKKTSFMPIIAVLLILAIVSGSTAAIIYFQDSEAALKKKLKAQTNKEIVEFYYGDYNKDYSKEAFAVVGEKEDDKNFTDGEIWFVTEKANEKITKVEKGALNGKIHDDRNEYLSVELFENEKSHSFVYGVKNETKYFEPDYSGKYSNVHQEDDEIVGLDENNNPFVIFTDDNDKNEENNSKEEFLEATDKDFKHLEEIGGFFLYNGTYDYLKTSMDDAVTYVLDLFVFLYSDYYSDSEFVFNEYDPKKRVVVGEYIADDTYDNDKWGGYAKAKAENVEWIIKNILNVEVDRNYQSPVSYYYDGYYYNQAIATGFEEQLIHKYVSSEKLDDGKYKIQMKCYIKPPTDEPEYLSGTEEVIAGLKNIDGKREWSFYKVTSKEIK